MEKIKWTGRFPEMPEYHCKGYIYCLQDDGSCHWIIRRPEDGYKPKGFRTYKGMIDYLFPDYTMIGPENEDSYLSYITGNCRSEGGNLYSISTEDNQGKEHKFAVDIRKKEIWEYFDWENVSPLFPRESELREWADWNLPRENEQMSIEDFIPPGK